MKTKTFKEILGNPSSAVLAMVEGIKSPKIVLDISTFGRNSSDQTLGPSLLGDDPPSVIKSKEICYGCAAAVTVLQTLPEYKKIYPDLYQETDLDDFEWVINDLRLGHFLSLLEYFGISEEAQSEIEGKIQQLPKIYDSVSVSSGNLLDSYTEFAEQLIELGL